jgi:hypothetical protein
MRKEEAGRAVVSARALAEEAMAAAGEGWRHVKEECGGVSAVVRKTGSLAASQSPSPRE